MFLDLNKADVEENVDLKIKLVKNKNNILIWTKIASVSFGQEIDEDIIRKIAEDKNIYLLLGYKKDIGVATALLYANSDVMGVHLVGVLKEYRGQGIAENLMKRAINFSKEKNIDVMVLQASILGLGIYKKLGFIKSFILRNYQKN